MVDLSPADTLDNWLFHPNEPAITESSSSSNESALPVTKVFSPLSNTDDQSSKKKRKQDPVTNDFQEKKKSKQTPSYMRRNIRHLYTNDKLQGDTLTALKAEQDRLKRLEEVNRCFPQFSAIYNQLTATNAQPTREEECIVLEDDENEEQTAEKYTTNSNSTERQTNDNDGSDSDVQYLEEDESDYIDDKMTQKLRRLHVDDRVNIPNENGDILTNISHPSDEPDLFIPKHLCSILKPHQIGGIRFLYDNIIQSLHSFQTTPGLGCILAHSMGCGKTIQIITFLDILLRYTQARSILIVVPINTLQNWVNEFNRWCPIDDPTIDYKRPYQLYLLNETSKKHQQRVDIVQNWSRTGGVLIIGYEMFRLMTTKKSLPISTASRTTVNSGGITDASNPSVIAKIEEEKNVEKIEDVRNTLLTSDLVICDEGHRIKNHQASVAIALKSIQTQRRIVLTGYPLQNNLLEYWCMVDFVRPNYLGSKKEFCNMFERPVLNGQCVDSTGEDRQLMRARAHVLHSLLEGFIQRRGHDVLQIDLPAKTEYIILLKLSPIQRQLYMKFLQSIGVLSNAYDRTMNPLRAFALCCKIWNHPDVLHKFIRNRQDGADLDLDLELDQNSNSTTRSSSAIRTQTDNNDGISTPVSFTEKKDFDYDFANSIWNTYVPGQLANGIKFQIALSIIDLSIRCGDKVLMFSQSLLSLDKLEEFLHLQQVPDCDQKWEKNVNYYRLDGATNSLERERLIHAFNTPESNVKLFLLSTRAGCLGINLIAANRVIVMDVSWNPCLDAQAVCRVYRYGQRKHCYIYRLIADFTMEKRIYDRQIAKQGMSDRVVDELQPQNQFTRNEVENLLHFAAEEEPAAADLVEKIDEFSTDGILSLICKHYAQSITKMPFTHESLLSDHKEHQMTSAEKRRAEKEYQHEKRMNNFTNRPRFNNYRSSSFHSRYINDYVQRSYHPPPPLPPPPPPTFPIMYSEQSNYDSIDRRIERARAQGSSVQPITLKNPLQVQINSLQREFIPAGTQIQMIKSPRGSYIRTPDGKFFAIRQSSSTTLIQPKPVPVIPSPPPPPPPPPPPQLPISHFFDDLLLDSPSLSSNEPFSSSMNDLTDEIDLLLGETDPTSSASSSTLDNIRSWQEDYLPSNDLFSDLFLDQSV